MNVGKREDGNQGRNREERKHISGRTVSVGRDRRGGERHIALSSLPEGESPVMEDKEEAFLRRIEGGGAGEAGGGMKSEGIIW